MIKERLASLRELMKDNKIDAYLVPSTDAHQSEYLPALWQRRQWISGFDGSAGDVVVTMNKAGLWTDSRYFLQAEKQLSGTTIDLYKIGVQGAPTIKDFLRNELKGGQYLGIDPRLVSHSEISSLIASLAAKKIGLKFIENNLIDEIWKDRPEMPLEKIMVWPIKYAGEPVESKLNRIREKMNAEDATAHVLTMLDAIAWTFNIRSKDVDFNPVVIAYAIITKSSAKLFVHPAKVNDELKGYLKGVAEIYDYNLFRDHLVNLAKGKEKVWLDGGTVNQWVVNLLEKDCELFYRDSPVTLFKARKNETELAGFKACHERDGIAMVKFLHWLGKAVPAGGVTEITAADRLEKFRAEDKLFQGLSFETISGYKEHGAIVHYSSTPETDVELKPEGIYLIDSGGQYLDGTTDITRTVALGKPTDEQKNRFTRVLKGHIDLSLTSFPGGTTGIQLDTIARKSLWDVGLNYGHGTGHGVGAYLGVHEGPHAISYYRGIGVPLESGMIVSNEPGYYKAGEYGIRIENLVNVVRDDEKSNNDFEFFKFDCPTLCPIDLNLVELSLLDKDEKEYLNGYHARVRKVLSPNLNEEQRLWLDNATCAL